MENDSWGSVGNEPREDSGNGSGNESREGLGDLGCMGRAQRDPMANPAGWSVGYGRAPGVQVSIS